MSYPATQPGTMQPIIKPSDLFEVPETERFILDINAGKIDVSLANWKELVQTACRSDLSPTPAPFIWWLFVSFSEIKDRDTRIHALYDIIDHLKVYLPELNLSDEQIQHYREECRALANFYRTIERQIVPYYGNSVGYQKQNIIRSGNKTPLVNL